MSDVINFSSIINKIDKVPKITPSTSSSFYNDLGIKSPIDRKIATLYILLKNAKDLDPTVGAGESYNVYSKALNYVKKDLSGKLVADDDGTSVNISVDKLINLLEKYIKPSKGVTASKDELEKTIKECPNFVRLMNFDNIGTLKDNITKLEKLSDYFDRNGDKGDKTYKNKIKEMVSSKLKNNDIDLDDINKNKISKQEEINKETEAKEQNKNEIKTSDEVDKKIDDDFKKAERALKGSAVVTHESPYKIFTGFDYDFGKMLQKCRANRHYNFAEEMSYFDKNLGEIFKFRKFIDDAKEKFPARALQYDKVIRNIDKHVKTINKLRNIANDNVSKVSEEGYLSKTDWRKYVNKILDCLSKMNLEVIKMESEYYSAGRPTREEMAAVRKEIRAKAHDEWLVNHVWGREVVKRFEDFKENIKYKNFIKKIETVMPEKEIEKLIDDYTKAFNTRDEYGHIKREALQKIWEIEKKVKSIDKEYKINDIRTLFGLSPEQIRQVDDGFKIIGAQRDKELDARNLLGEIKNLASELNSHKTQAADPKEKEKIQKKQKELLDDIEKIVGKNSSIYKEAEDAINQKKGIMDRVLDKINKKLHPETKPSEQQKENNEKKDSIINRLSSDPKKARIMDIWNELENIFSSQKDNEINRRKVLRLLQELKAINPAQHQMAMNYFKIPKSTDENRIESNISRLLRTSGQKTKAIPEKASNSFKNIGYKIKDWAQRQIDKQYEKKPKNMNEDLATTIGLGVGAVIFYTSLAAAVTWGTSLALTSWGKGIVKIAKSVRNMWIKLGKEFTEEDVEKKVKKMSESKEAQKTIDKIEKTEDRYYDELRKIYSSIENKDWEEAAENFKDLPSGLQSNLDVLKAIINKISEVNEEPPLYINSPGNSTYQAIKKIIGIKVAKSAAEAVRKAIN